MKRFFLNSALLVMLVSCSGRNNAERVSGSMNYDDIVKANKIMVDYDAEMIRSFIVRKGWNMIESSAGFWYMVYERGTGDSIYFGDEVLYNYKVSLLDGTLCYTSDSTGPKRLWIGKSNDESGLHAGFSLLRYGDKARFIFPPHMAFGLLGDRDKIPMRSTIVYEVELFDKR